MLRELLMNKADSNSSVSGEEKEEIPADDGGTMEKM